MKKIKIEKGTVQETLIIPLYARRLCNQRFASLYNDPSADEICERLDYDFSELDKKSQSTAYEFGALEGAMRQLDMMWEINDYLKDYPKASIVCFGCGLDQDPRKCGGPENKIYNLDFPDTIAAREELIGVDPRETNIPGDINDLSWINQIDALNGVIFYAAGVIHYFKKDDVRKLVEAMADQFPGGCFIFDVLNERGFKMMMKYVLKTWGMEDAAAYFRTNDAVKELSAWSDRIEVSVRDYMLGYYDMKNPEIKGIHRFLAKIADKYLGMKIVKIRFLQETTSM